MPGKVFTSNQAESLSPKSLPSVITAGPGGRGWGSGAVDPREDAQNSCSCSASRTWPPSRGASECGAWFVKCHCRPDLCPPVRRSLGKEFSLTFPGAPHLNS